MVRLGKSHTFPAGTTGNQSDTDPTTGGYKMRYKVIQTLLNRDGNSVDMQFYSGTSLAQAMSAVSTVLASTESPDQEFYTIVGVRVEIEEA